MRFVREADGWLGVGCHSWAAMMGSSSGFSGWSSRVLRCSGLGGDLRLSSVCVNLNVTGWWNRWLPHYLPGCQGRDTGFTGAVERVLLVPRKCHLCALSLWSQLLPALSSRQPCY